MDFLIFELKVDFKPFNSHNQVILKMTKMKYEIFNTQVCFCLFVF